jgi:hypothetical protein
VAAACLAVTLLAVPLLGKMQMLEALDAETGRLKPHAEQIMKARTERDKIDALRATVASLKKTAVSPLAVMAKLSGLLDDSTYLLDYRFENATVTLTGFSSDATKLAQQLGAAPEFKAVKFSGPVARDPQSSRDRFTLILELGSR